MSVEDSPGELGLDGALEAARGPQRDPVPDSVRDLELAQITLASIGEGLIRTDAAGRVNYMNPMAERLTGWSAGEAAGRDLTEVYPVVHTSTRQSRSNPVSICLAERRTVTPQGLFALASRGGQELTVRDTISPLLSEAGAALGAVVVFRDLTRGRTLGNEASYAGSHDRASHDRLTGLLERQELELYLEAALRSSRERHGTHTVLHLDLRELELVNDCHGHVAGDELLRQAASLLREVLGDETVIARLGGGDFVALLEDYSLERAAALAHRVERRSREFRFSWGGQLLEVGFAIGAVAVDPSAGSRFANALQLLQAAATASYFARRRGRYGIWVQTPDETGLLDERHGRLRWVQRVRRALSEDRLVLYHQRIEPLRGGRPLHEILVRMRGDDGEVILPGEFVPVAESHELITLVDRWVLRRSLELLAAGHLEGERVSVNLSAQSLGDEVFLEDAVTALLVSGVDPGRLCFEITETSAVSNFARALRFIGAFAEMGCGFVLDDFGSGFSSFGYLKNLPVDIVKIDGQFIRDLEKDPISRAMVSSINEIAHLMSIETIAEWVEDEATLDTVRSMGLDYVQGFLRHRPEPIVR